MHKIPLAAVALIFAACGSDSVPPHELDVELDYGGVISHAVIAFPEHHPGRVQSDEGCFGFSTCSHRLTTSGTIHDERDLISSASVEASEEPLRPAYRIKIRRTEEDQKAFTAPREEGINIYAVEPYISCFAGVEELKEPVKCFFSSELVFITLRLRHVER